MTAMRFHVPNETEMLRLGGDLIDAMGSGDVVYLRGDLGMGKTTLVRGLLQAMGCEERIKSPSYGLVESYAFDHPRWPKQVHHLDLYRLEDPEEVTFLGVEALMGEDQLLLIEWPERGQGVLPPASVCIAITETADGGRAVSYERVAAG